MKKIVITALITLLAIGAFNQTYLVADPHYRYRECIVITKGFYQSLRGIVTEARLGDWRQYCYRIEGELMGFSVYLADIPEGYLLPMACLPRFLEEK